MPIILFERPLNALYHILRFSSAAISHFLLTRALMCMYVRKSTFCVFLGSGVNITTNLCINKITFTKYRMLPRYMYHDSLLVIILGTLIICDKSMLTGRHLLPAKGVIRLRRSFDKCGSNIYKHAIKYRNILYNDNDYIDNYTIIIINLTTSISIYHLNQSTADTRCPRLYFFIISILLCVLICKDQK